MQSILHYGLLILLGVVVIKLVGSVSEVLNSRCEVVNTSHQVVSSLIVTEVVNVLSLYVFP